MNMLCSNSKICFVPNIDIVPVAVCRVLLLYVQPGEVYEGTALHWTPPQLATLRYAALGLLHSMAPCFPQVSPILSSYCWPACVLVRIYDPAKVHGSVDCLQTVSVGNISGRCCCHNYADLLASPAVLCCSQNATNKDLVLSAGIR